MHDIVIMIQNGSVVVLSVLGVAEIQSRYADRLWLRGLLIGLLFTAVGMVVMENSVEVMPGVRTDPRAAVVTLSAAFGGPIAVLITAPSLALVRMMYGGIGAVPGAIYILGLGIVAGLVWYWWFRVARQKIDLRYVLLQATVAGTVPTILLLYLSSAPWSIFLASNGLLAPTNFIAAFLMGVMVLRDLERRAAVAARAEIEAHIDAIADNAPVVLFQMVRDDDGRPRFTYVSRAANRIFGLAPETLIASFDAFEEIARGKAAMVIGQELQESEETGMSWDLEIECARADGEPIWVYIDAGVRRDPAGRIVWDGSISDITQQKIAEQTKDEFISTVSHELRTPLTSIRGSLGLVMGNASVQLSPNVAKMLEIANRNAERLVLLINDILDMQKIRLGQLHFSLKREELQPHLDQALTFAQSYAPEKRISVALINEAPGCEANIDPARFNQVLANLLSNAVKFSPAGGTIVLSVQRQRGKLRISVADEGPGISKEFRNRIFGRFNQAESSYTRSAGGTGLGLNISRSIVEAMNGKLSFDSVQGRGSTFHVDLPMVGAANLQERPSQLTMATERRVLICCNDPDLNQNMRHSLTVENFSCDTASDVTTALRLISDRSYAALIVDGATLKSPEAFQQLRGDPLTVELPIVVISAEADETAKLISGSNEGAIRWLERPFDDDRFIGALTSALSAIDRRRPRVLYVEDDTLLQEVIKQNVGERVRMTGATSLATAREQIAAGGFDLVVLDLDLPDGSGVDLLDELPEDMPVIIFSALEVSPDIVHRVTSVMTKSRIKESDVARAIIAVLSGKIEASAHQPEVA